MNREPVRIRRVRSRRSGYLLSVAAALSALSTNSPAAPTVTSLFPADGATLIGGRQAFRLQFGSAVQAGTGNIVLKNSSDNSTFESIPVTSSQVSFGSAALLYGFESTVEDWGTWGNAPRSWDNSQHRTGSGALKATTTGSFTQIEGRFPSQNWSGYDSIVCWIYTTLSGASAVTYTRSGNIDKWNDAIVFPGASLAQNTWTRVASPISSSYDPTRIQSFGLNLSSAGTYWVDDVSLVKAGTTYVTVVPSKEFALSSGYYVNIDAGAIKDLSNSNYTGISNATTWNFTTDNPPTNIALSSTTVADNSPTKTMVGLLTATDLDVGEAFDFSLDGGTGSTDNASFQIRYGSDTLFTNATFDFETKSSYSIRLRAYDRRGAFFDKIFTISVANGTDRLRWDNSTTAGTQSGSGTWGTDNFWSYDGTNLIAWPGTGHPAEFAGTDGNYTITVNGTQSADTVIFTNKGYTLAGGTVAAPIIVSNAKATISSPVSGSFSKSGSDTLVLSGNNNTASTYTHLAGTTIASSAIALGTGAVAMNGSGGIYLSNGLSLSNALTISACNPGVGYSVLNTVPNANAIWSGAFDVNADCTNGGHISGAPTGTGALTISGPIHMGGTATSVVQRDGTVVYSGSGTATRFELTSGTARVAGTNGIPSGTIWQQSHPALVSTLDLNGFNQNFAMLYSPNPAASIRNTQATSVLTLNGIGDTTYGGSITGNVAIAKSGSGRQTFSGTNTYVGPTTITGGTLALKSASALGSTNSIAVTGGGTLDLGGQTVAASPNLTLSGNGVSGNGALTNSGTTDGVYSGLVTLGSSATVSGATGKLLLTNSGSINGAGFNLALGGAQGGSVYGVVANGTGGLTKKDAGTWLLFATSSYSGATSILAGTLQLAIDNALPAASDLTVTGVLDLNGYNQTIASLAGSGTIDKSSGAGVSSISVGATNSNSLFSGVIMNSSGKTSLTKTGTGTLTLSGANTYAGSTTISAGTIKVGATNALSASSPTTVTGKLDLGGFSTAIGSLAGVGTVDNSTGTGVYTLTTGADTTSTVFSGVFKNTVGSLALTKIGTGTLALSGANTNSGTTTISGGTLSVTGTLASPVTASAGATLSGTGTLSGTITVSGGAIAPGFSGTKGILNTSRADLSTGTGSTLKIRLASYSTAGTDFDRLKSTDTVVLGGTSVLNVDLSGITTAGTAYGIVQALGIKGKFSSVVASNATGYSVGVIYNATSIDLVVIPSTTTKLIWDNNVAAGIQPASGTWGTDNFWTDNGTRLYPWLNNGFTSEFAGADGSYTITVNGNQLVDSLSFLNSGYTLSQGALTLGNGVGVASGKSDTLDQTVVSGIGLTLSGGGTLVVRNSTDQSFGFLDIVNGTYMASRTSGPTGNKLGAGTVTVSSGSTLVMDRLLQGDTYTNPLNLSGSGNGSGALLFQNNSYGMTLNSPITLQADTRIGSSTIGRSAANDFVSLGGTISGPYNLTLSAYHGILRSTGIISVGGNVTIDQTDTVMLYKSNTYAGNTVVSGGTLQLGAADVIPNGSGKGDLSVTATVDLNGFSEAVNGLSGSGIVDDLATGAATMSVGDNNRSSVFAGMLKSSRGILSLTKIGTGTLNLSGSNTYKGATLVDAGTLNVSGGIDSTSTVTVASGATLSGAGSIGGTIVGNGGTIQPGDTGSIGVMEAKRIDLSSATASTLRIRIKATSKPGIEYDRLMLSDTLVLGGNSVLELDLAGLSEVGSASGIVMAGGIAGTFKTVKVVNYAGSQGVSVTYRQTSINIVFNNHAPSYVAGPNQTVREDTASQSIAGWATAVSAGSPEESGQILSFTTTNSNNALFSAQPAVAPDGTLTYAPAHDANGVSTVSVKLRDDGGTAGGGIDSAATRTFTITVTPVNDTPIFTKGVDQGILVNTGAQTIASWASGIAPGPADESSQIVGFRTSNSKPALFSIQPSVGPTGTLTYTPAPDAVGSARVYLRLGDNGGTTNGGVDSSAIDSFTILIHAPLSYKLSPDTLRIRPGDTGTFRVAAKNGAGVDTILDPSDLSWSWNPSRGTLSNGHVSANQEGTAYVTARGLGLSDSAFLVVAALDTSLHSSKDSTTIDAGHGVTVTVPPHDSSIQIGVEIKDSVLGGGIAGADTSVSITGTVGSTDSVLLKIPKALVPLAQIRLHGTPSAYWMDSTGKLHQAATILQADSSLVFWGRLGLTYWLGYDTLAPTTGSKVTGDSLTAVDSQRVNWTVSDNVANTKTYFCILQAGKSAPACSLLVASDSTHGSQVFSAVQLPLGGRIWMESRDAINTTRSQQMDIVVRIDSLRSPVKRQEDRYELLSLPYTKGKSSAHANLVRMWGTDNAKRWRAFTIDTTTDFGELVAGDTLDAWGKAFWVRTRKVDLVPWVAGGWTPPVSNPVVVSLHHGWNAVGNPLGFDVDWRQIRKLSGLDTMAVFGPYHFDATRQTWSTPDTTTALSAWSGVAVLNATGRTIDLKIPSIASGAFAPRRAASKGLLRIGLTGSQGSDTAQMVWLGIDASVAPGWNALDFPLPPSPIGSLKLALPAPFGARTTLPFLSDIRPPADTGVQWTVHLTGIRPGVPLVLDLATTNSDTSALWIRDLKSARWLPAGRRMDFAVGSETSRDFQIMAGAIPRDLRAGRKFSLGNHGRGLAWSLPDDMGRTRVKIEMLDMLGRKTATLLDETMDPGSYAREFVLPYSIAQQIVLLSAGGKQQALIRLRSR